MRPAPRPEFSTRETAMSIATGTVAPSNNAGTSRTRAAPRAMIDIDCPNEPMTAPTTNSLREPRSTNRSADTIHAAPIASSRIANVSKLARQRRGSIEYVQLPIAMPKRNTASIVEKAYVEL
jgi:hypothetical protein